MTLQRCFTCLVVCLLTLSAAANHRGQLENFYYDKNMEKGMFSYGFEVEPMDNVKSRDLSTGMSFSVRHHRHDDGTQSWGYAIGSGPLPESALQESGPSAGTTSQPAPSAPSSSEFPVLTVRPSGPSAPAVSPGVFQAVSPGVFQASGGGLRPVYVRRDQLPSERDPLSDGLLLLGSQKVHQVVPFDGDFGARLPRRLWRGDMRRGGFRRRQQVRQRPQQTEQQQPEVNPSEQQEPALYPSAEQQEPEVYPSEQEEPPVTTYRPSVRPTLATAVLEEPISAPGADFDQSAPSAPIRVTQVAAAAQPVTEYRGSDGSSRLPGSDPRFQPRPFGARALPGVPGVFPPSARGGASFGFGQQRPPFRGNFPTGPSQAFNGFPSNNFFENANAGPQNNGFFGNDFPPTSGSSFGDRNNAQLVGSDNDIRTSDQFQTTENAWQGRYPENNFDQFSGSQQISDEPSSTASPLPQDDNRANPNHSADFTNTPSKANDVAPLDNDKSPAQSYDNRQRYRDGDSGGLTNTRSTTKRPRIRSGGRRPARRRQRPASDSSPLLSASHTPDANDDEKVFAVPDSPSVGDGSRSGAGFRRRPSKAILLTAASVYQDDTNERPEPARVAVGQFVDPLNGTRIVIRRRLKKIPRVSTDKTTEPSAAGEDDRNGPSTTETPLHASLVDDESSQDHSTAEPTYRPDRHPGRRPRVLAVGGRRHNRMQPRRKNTSTTETPATGATLKDVHPVEAPPTRRYRQRSRSEKQREDDAPSRQRAEHSGDELIAAGEESDSDAVLARPPTDRLSPLEQRKAAREGNRRGPLNKRRRPPGRDSDGNDDDTSSTGDERELARPGRRRGNRPAPRRRGRPQRGPGIVRPGLRTITAPETQPETTAPPEFDVTTPSGVSDDGETSFSTIAAVPTEEPARRRGASRLRRPGRPRGPGGRHWRTEQEDDGKDRAGPTSAPSLPSQPSTVSGPSYLPTTELGVIVPPSTAQGPSYLPTTESGPTTTTYYPPSTAQGKSYLPSTEPGPATIPTTVKPRSLMDRYNEDHLSATQAREEELRAQFDRNLAARREQHSDDSPEENFRSLFNRKLDEKLGSPADDSQPTTTQAPIRDDDSDEVLLDDAASRAARINALFARYTKATRPPSTTTDPPFLTSTTTLDPREVQLRALFAQYTEATTTADPTSSTSDVDLQKLFVQHVQSLGTTVPTPVIVESFKSSVSRVGATPGGGAEADREEEDGRRRIPARGGYLPQPTTPTPFAESTVADVPPRAGTRQPDLDRSQAPSPLGRPGSPASNLRPPSDNGKGQDRDQQQQQQGATEPQRTIATTRRRPTTPQPFREPTTRADSTQLTLDDILESARPTTRLASPKSGNEVRFSDAPRSTTRRPTRRPEPARPFDGLNGIDDERHAEKLTLDGDSGQETTTRPSAPELRLPVSSGALSVATSLLVVLLSSWLSLTALKLTL